MATSRVDADVATIFDNNACGGNAPHTVFYAAAHTSSNSDGALAVANIILSKPSIFKRSTKCHNQKKYIARNSKDRKRKRSLTFAIERAATSG